MITILGIIFGLNKEYKKCKKELIDINQMLNIYKQSLLLIQEKNIELKEENKHLLFRIRSLENLLKLACEPEKTQESYINPMYI